MAVDRPAGVPLRRGVAAVAATLLAVTLLAVGCSPGTGRSPGLVVQAGGDYLVDHWPLRGSLAGDAGLRGEVAAVVAQWRTPEGMATHDEASALLWLGEVDGAVLGVVDFRPADNPNKTWLLELTGRPGDLAVTGARSHDGTALDEDLLPVRSPAVGTRYLASTRVGALAGPATRLSMGDHGLTVPVDLPACGVTGLTLRVAGEQQWYADLGTGLAEPSYPLLRDGWLGGPAAAALAGVDTCAAMAPDGWLGAVGEADGRPAVRIGGYPALRRLGATDPGAADPDPPGALARVHVEYTSTGSGILLSYWLVWSYPAGEVGEVAVDGPPGVEIVVAGPGLAVLRLAERTWDGPVELRYIRDGEGHRVTVTPP